MVDVKSAAVFSCEVVRGGLVFLSPSLVYAGRQGVVQGVGGLCRRGRYPGVVENSTDGRLADHQSIESPSRLLLSTSFLPGDEDSCKTV
jgi:hypothetical protein